jgi:phosphoglycerate kinase
MKTLRDINLENKKIFLRAGFDVPLGDDERIDGKEDWRIKAGLPTIKFLLQKKCKIILATHLGRPGGKAVKELSTKPIQEKLSDILNLSVKKASDCIGLEVEKMADKMGNGEILLLENLRFHKEEEENQENFAKELASLGEIYINDAFSVCHREHASIVGIPKFLPSAIGILLEKEIKILSKAIKDPQVPAIAIIGGAKIKTKLPVINSLSEKYNKILVGGLTAVEAKTKNLKFRENVFLADDFIEKDGKKLDIGKESIKKFIEIISEAKTIVWNGPVGKFEETEYAKGTQKIAEEITESKAFKIIGGGDTILAVSKFGLIEKFDFVSTGGGAMLEFLSGKELPGLKALEN